MYIKHFLLSVSGGENICLIVATDDTSLNEKVVTALNEHFVGDNISFPELEFNDINVGDYPKELPVRTYSGNERINIEALVLY